MGNNNKFMLLNVCTIIDYLTWFCNKSLFTILDKIIIPTQNKLVFQKFEDLNLLINLNRINHA